MPKPNCVCATCGKKFRKYPCRIKRLNFCCTECSHKGRKGKRKEQKKAKKSVEVQCDYCGKSFHKQFSRVKKYKNHYCDVYCKNSAQTGIKHSNERNTNRSNSIKSYYKEENRLNYVKEWARVKCPPAFIAMAMLDGKVNVHRLLVAKALGRCLKVEEVVHHIDGDAKNNSLKNLALFKSQSDHASYHCDKKPKPIWTGS